MFFILVNCASVFGITLGTNSFGLLNSPYASAEIAFRFFLKFFGGKKIPELMNGLGKGVKSFKDGMNGKDEDPKKENGD